MGAVIHVVGGGLAGSEAAFQLAERGHRIPGLIAERSQRGSGGPSNLDVGVLKGLHQRRHGLFRLRQNDPEVRRRYNPDTLVFILQIGQEQRRDSACVERAP